MTPISRLSKSAGIAPATAPITSITIEVFLADSHAARYRDIVQGQPEGFARVLEILSDPEQQTELLAAERYGRPALAGIVKVVEADEAIAASLAAPAGARFRQAVGVAVRLAMESLGWSRTGRKGPVRGAAQFKRAEHYQPTHLATPSMAAGDRARAALEAVERIGDEGERAQTANDLLVALAQTRGAEGRPF